MDEKGEVGKSAVEMVCEALFDFAIDRRDVVDIAARLPECPDARRATVEHELQILKIISVGWGLSYCMPAGGLKEEITTRFWQAVQDFSYSLSSTTELLIQHALACFFRSFFPGSHIPSARVPIYQKLAARTAKKAALCMLFQKCSKNRV
jgi:hypothetical protein